MRLSTIEMIVQACADSLNDALVHYWPTTDETEMSERNLTLHFARVLAGAGFCCYAECRWAAQASASSLDARSRLDMLAWQPRRRTLLLVESKRLHNVDGVHSIVRDIGRIFRFRPQGQLGALARHRFGVVLASTWNPKIASWWKSTGRDPWPKGTSAWGALPRDERRRVEGGCCDAVSLETASVHPGRAHSLLYSVFPLA